jgi:archaemetzincin
VNLRLTLVPFQDVGRRHIEQLAHDLRSLGVAVRVHDPVTPASGAYQSQRGQYRADVLLSQLSGIEGDHVLGVTDADCYVDRLSFVFGLAERPGRAAMIALHRLHSDEEALFRERTVKEAVHELGHTLGLSHCPDPRCVMHFSNSLTDTDNKGGGFCTRCRARLPSRFAEFAAVP